MTGYYILMYSYLVIMRHILSLLAAVMISAEMFAGQSVYTKKFDDPKGVFFTSESYGIVPDGKYDCSTALQEALNTIKKERGFGTLYLPEGKYLISKTIYVPDAIRIIGYGSVRPEIVLAKNTAGFAEKETPMVWFTGGIVTDPEKVREASAGTFYSGISNVNIRIGKGNPYAVGLRTHFAQHGIVSHVDIYGSDSYACLSEAGNELEDVEFHGARYGITSSTSSPSWPIMIVDAFFEGQREAAIATRNAGFAIVNMKVKNAPVGVICDEKRADRLFLEDCFFENVGKAVVITGEEGSTNQFNMLNTYCKNVPVAVELTEKGEICRAVSGMYRINEYVFGLLAKDMTDDADYGTVCDMEPAEFPSRFERTIPALPDMSLWSSVCGYGAVGDGQTDDTQAIQKAIDENDVVFLPEGWYRITNTIRLRPGSRLIGLHPFSTQLVLAESTPAFSGFGSPVPMLVSSQGGDDILTGIGICTGGYNNRAVGVKWMAGEKSLMNDIKFVGGHGTMRRPSPEAANANVSFQMYRPGMIAVSSPSSPVAVQGLDRAWDNQYWSLWITDGGGGTFKDIWTANSYASSGLYVSNTRTPSKIYAISLEHHVRFESRWRNVENFKVYAMQYEEESREGKDAVAMTMDNCRNIMFANTWFYRVVRVVTPRDYGIIASNCRDIVLRNTKVWTQIRCETAAAAYDVNKNISLYPLDFAYGKISGSEKGARTQPGIGEIVEIGDNYQFPTGAVSDSKGNVYFCEGLSRKIYKWDASTETLTLLADYPFRPQSLAVDTEDNLLVICRYEGQPGYDGYSIRPIAAMQDANSDYSGWGNGNWEVSAYAIITRQDGDTMIPLNLVKTSGIHPSRIIYPSHALRSEDFLGIYNAGLPDMCFVAPDGKTVIPYLFDICRAMETTAVTPGQMAPVFIPWENPRRTYEFKVNADGSLASTGKYYKHGEYAVAYDKSGNIYIGEGKIHVLDSAGNLTGRINVDERPISMEFGGEEGEYLFITTNRSFYKMRIK